MRPPYHLGYRRQNRALLARPYAQMAHRPASRWPMPSHWHHWARSLWPLPTKHRTIPQDHWWVSHCYDHWGPKMRPRILSQFNVFLNGCWEHVAQCIRAKVWALDKFWVLFTFTSPESPLPSQIEVGNETMSARTR